MVNNGLDKETISKIGQHIANQEFDKISLEDIKKIENEIRGKRKIAGVILSNIKPALVIITMIEFFIFTTLVGDSTNAVLIFYGFLPFFNNFFIGFVLFSISEFANFRKEHMAFSFISPIIVFFASFAFKKSPQSLNSDAMAALVILSLVYLVYTMFVMIVFNSTADKLVGYLFSRLNTITFNKENAVVFKLDKDIKNGLIYKYITIMLAQFLNLGVFDSKKSEEYKSIIFSSYDLKSNEPPMYDKLIKYYLFMFVDIKNSTIAFSYFKKYFDRLIIDEPAIEENKLLYYYLPNICKYLKKTTLENFEDMNKSFNTFDNELFGKRRGSKMEKVGWLFNKYVIITFVITVILLAMYSYSLFSSTANWISSHETLASGIIGAIVVIFAQFILRQRTR